MAGTFTLTEDAARYGVTDPGVIDYFNTDQYGGFMLAMNAAASAHNWVSGQAASFTADLPDGHHMLFTGTPFQYTVYVPKLGTATSFAIDSMVYEAPDGTPLVRFAHDVDNGAGLGDGNVLALTNAKVNFVGNSANNVFTPTVDTLDVKFDGGGGFNTVDLRGHTTYNGIAMHAGTPFTGVAPDGTFVLSFTWEDSFHLTYRSPNYDFSNVQRVVADTWAIAYDLNGNAGEAYRLYQAAFDRHPDLPGLGFQINALDMGFALHDVAQNFLNSPEFQSLYGTNVSDEAYITALYHNVLHRDPDPGGYAYQLDALKTYDRAQLLENFSESPENQANVLGSIYAGIVYTPDH